MPWSVAPSYDNGGRGEYIAVAADGTIYVADENSDEIRAIAPDGTRTLLVGLHSDPALIDGPQATARFTVIRGLTIGPDGHLYVAQAGAVRKVSLPGASVTTLAGSSTNGIPVDGTGAAAVFRNITGIAVGPSGNVYVGDGYHDGDSVTIRKVTVGGVVTTLAGDDGASPAASTDGTGSAARFAKAVGLVTDADDNVYAIDNDSSISRYVIRKVTPAGVATTIFTIPPGLGSGGWGMGQYGDRLYLPFTAGVGDTNGNLYRIDVHTNAWSHDDVAEPSALDLPLLYDIVAVSPTLLIGADYAHGRVLRWTYTPALDPTPPTHTPPTAPPTAPPFGSDYPDNFTPDATAPAAPGLTTMTVLDAVRAFSAAVRRAVRLTAATSIEMVDPNTPPLPTGMSVEDAASMYHSSDLTVAASGDTLRLAAGNETVAVTAELVTNDVRLITSDWLIPNQLPVYGPGLRPAPVKRFAYTMTPHALTASVEFAFPAVPAAVRR